VSAPPMVEVKDLSFHYGEGGFTLALPELTIATGEKVAFVGPSGSGKTTLVYLIAGILEPDAGTVTVGGTKLAGMGDAGRRNFRISNIGFIFQEFELLDYLTTVENVMLPYLVNSSLVLDATVRESARELLDSVGLCDMFDRKPEQLSHGERQRVAVCRALITKPKIIVADEPTGNLDPENKASILDIIADQVTQRDATLIVVTHDHSLLERFDRTIDLGRAAGGECST